MKSKLLKIVLTALLFFLFISVFYTVFYLWPGVSYKEASRQEARAIIERKSDLIEIRLALMEVAKSSPSDARVSEKISYSLERIDENLKNSSKLYEKNFQIPAHKKIIAEDKRVTTQIQKMYGTLRQNHEVYGDLLAYKPETYLLGPLYRGDYEIFLKGIQEAREGIGKYTQDELIGDDANNTAASLLAIEQLGIIEDSDKVAVVMDEVVSGLDQLKRKSHQIIVADLKTEENIMALTDLTNLIISYNIESN